MKRVKAFPYVFFHSLTSILYYKEILKSKRSFSIKYFLVLATLASLVSALSLSFRVTPLVRNTIDIVINQMEKMYPDDLVISYKDTAWSINKNQPYIIPFVFDKEIPQDNLPKNFVVLHKEGTIDDIEKYDTFILINEKNILVKSQDKLEAYPLKDIPNGEFTKKNLTEALNRLRGLVGLIELSVVVIISFFIVLYNFVFRAFYLVFVALFIWVLALITGGEYTYKQTYRIGLHTMTLPIVVELMLITAGLKFQLPFWFMLLNIIFASVVTIGLTKIRQTVVTSHKPKSQRF